jgi:hypothetical protein
MNREKLYITKKYLATPNSNDEIDAKYFARVSDATDYLNKATGNDFDADDWKLVGKIKKLTNLYTDGKTTWFKFGEFDGVKYI